MKLYSISSGALKSISSRDFKLEKDIQNLVEKNLEELFHIHFVKSELQVTDFRIDTLAFDKENKAFVIIEYKRERNYAVIDQGYTYLSLLLNNKSDFILEYNENCNEKLKRGDVDWSQSRIIFISPQFTEYQKHSVDFKDVPFELWEIKMYDNNTLSLNQYKTASKASISSTSSDKRGLINQVSKEIKVYTEDYHLTRSRSRPGWVNELYLAIKDKLLNLGDVEIVYRGNYVSFRGRRHFVDIIFWNKGLVLIINLKKGTLSDPNNLTKDISGVGHWGNGDYQIVVNNDTDLDYVMFLVKQSYNG